MVQRIEPGWPHTKQVSYLLYYLWWILIPSFNAIFLCHLPSPSPHEQLRPVLLLSKLSIHLNILTLPTLWPSFSAFKTCLAEGKHLTSICCIELNRDSNFPIYQFLLPNDTDLSQANRIQLFLGYGVILMRNP